MPEIGWIIIVVAFTILIPLALRAAWRNGVTDGYGFSREPRNPGYQKAGKYLKQNMAHRWVELESTRTNDEIDQLLRYH